MAGAYVTRIDPHYGTQPGKPIVLVGLSTALADIYPFFTLSKPLQNAKKVEFKGRFHPEPTDAGRQVSPPAKGHKTLVSVGEPQVSGPLRT